MSVTLSDLSDLVDAALPRGGGDLSVSEVGLDSTELSAGALFAALPGSRAHGATYAPGTQAAAILTDHAGAELLADDPRPLLVVDDVRSILGTASAAIYGDPTADMTVIGITGTSGKTTTSYLVERGLMAEGVRVGLIGTTGTRIDGLPVPTALTTPEAPKLQQLFARMRGEGVTHVVMEVSSHALALKRVLGTRFDIAGFTNLSPDHLDFHRTMEEYFETKALLFDPSSPMAAERAVVVVDDEWGRRMAERAPRVETVTTRGADATWRAGDSRTHDSGAQSFALSGPTGDLPVDLPLPGRFNVANAALAIALTGGRRGVLRGIAEVSVPGRMERIEAGQDYLAVVDYAHKPAAVAEILDTLREQVLGRIAVVLGAGGNRDTEKRPLMGKAAASRADLVVVTDDNPRDEDPARIRAEIVGGTSGCPAEVRVVPDRRQAIREVVSWAAPGDAVVVAGKGHETGQVVGGVTHRFDDRDELRAAIRATGI